jgi:hypothetical protein
MKRPDGGGMETPVSMMLLVFTALLIGSAIVARSPEGDPDDLPSIRLIQARSLSFAISQYMTSEGEDAGMLVGDERLHLWSDGRGNISYSRDPGRAEEALGALLSSTPDGLEASVLFSTDEEDLPDLEGSRFSSRSDLQSGMFLTVTLPYHRGSMHLMEGGA